MNERQWFESFIAQLKEKGISFENPLSLSLVKIVNKDYENHTTESSIIMANTESDAQLEFLPTALNATTMLFMPPDTERLYQGDDYLEFLRNKMRDPSSFTDEEIKKIYNLANEGNIIIDQIDNEVDGFTNFCHVFVTDDNEAKITKPSDWKTCNIWYDNLNTKKLSEARKFAKSDGFQFIREAEFVRKKDIEEHKQHYTPEEIKEITDNGYTIDEFNKVAYQIFKLIDYKDMMSFATGVNNDESVKLGSKYDDERYDTVTKLCDKYKWALVEQPLLFRAIRYPEWYQGEQRKRLTTTAQQLGKTANGFLSQKYGSDIVEAAYTKPLVSFDKVLRKKLKLTPFQQPVLGSVKDYQGKDVNLNDYDSYAKFFHESGEKARPFTINGKLYVYSAESLDEALTVDQTRQIEQKYNALLKKFKDYSDNSERCKKILADLERKQKMMPDVKHQCALSNNRLQNIWNIGKGERTEYKNDLNAMLDPSEEQHAQYEALAELDSLMQQVADKEYQFTPEEKHKEENIKIRKDAFSGYLTKVKNDLLATGKSSKDSIRYQNLVEGVDIAIKYVEKATSNEEIADITEMLGNRASRYYYENIDLVMDSKNEKRFNIASKLVASVAGIIKDKDIIINDIAAKMVMHEAREMVEGDDASKFEIGHAIFVNENERTFRINVIKDSTKFIAMINGKTTKELLELFKQSPEKLLDKVKPDYEVAHMKEQHRPEHLIKARNFIRTYKELLDETGTTVGDSPEFKNLKTALDTAYKDIAEKYTAAEGDEVLDELAKAANAYYVAKLDQSMNTRRATRFKIAEILRNGMNPVTPEQRLKDRIAGKMIIAEAKKMQKSSNEEIVHKGENTLKDMTSFKQAVKNMQDTDEFKTFVSKKNSIELTKTFNTSASKLTQEVKNLWLGSQL